MRLILTVALVALLWAGVNGQCATDRYGQDCTCTSDLSQLDTVGTTLTCSNGVWNSTGPVIVSSLVDIMYDTLWVPAGVGNAITVAPTGNLTIHVRQFADLSIDQGFVETPGNVDATGAIHLLFDSLEQGSWSIQFMAYGSLSGNHQFTISSNVTQFTCRNYTAPVGDVFLSNEARMNFTVTNTAEKCGFNKGSRDWALWAYIAIASFGGLVIIFTIFTCVINPWRKLIWYPPM